MDRRDLATWVEGPRSALQQAGIDLGYRGERFGLPEEGPGSVAGWGKRGFAIVIDWLACTVVARLLFRSFTETPGDGRLGFAILGIFFAVVTIFTILGGASFGQRIMGIRVMSLRKPYVDPPRAALRTLLICLLIPAVIYDRDARGLHDKAAGTIVVKAR